MVRNSLATALVWILAQTTPVQNVEFSPTWVEIIKQGGFLSALLIVLYFYRRDFIAKNEKTEEEKKVLLEIIKDNTGATKEQTVALEQQKAALDRLSRAVEVGNLAIEVKTAQAKAHSHLRDNA